MPYLGTSFFQRDVLTVSRDLIGVELVWRGCAGTIVETEAYTVEGDPACHTATRPSAREFVKTHPPGAAYVYFNYGMYWLFNLLVKGGSRDGLILIRALAPTRGIPQMQQRRHREKLHELCSGPGKLAQALAIDGTHHGLPMTGKGRPSGCGLVQPATSTHEIVTDIRVGISQAVDYPWRFLSSHSPHVSVKHGKVKLPVTNAQK
ncbi:DNA-3-methyladenine glycosylase [Prosthecobacter vanneervenii]|uniref:Putative 3-methyladenine DNA glycosylase n=1 Tax=Prosthecobacter vanneervenii TaxID=48466 RepID=A0A7W7YAS4_9BACT|nr:DNA-3-methyladenine glycosylase [Prosthecobacter vanneervenii]MBB5032782.1 DNA-3-methyladenine glycosylase [Prosthecobacter vanneervenii]